MNRIGPRMLSSGTPLYWAACALPKNNQWTTLVLFRGSLRKKVHVYRKRKEYVLRLLFVWNFLFRKLQSKLLDIVTTATIETSKTCHESNKIPTWRRWNSKIIRVNEEGSMILVNWKQRLQNTTKYRANKLKTKGREANYCVDIWGRNPDSHNNNSTSK